MFPDRIQTPNGGDSPLANVNAAARLWPELLAFLAGSGGQTGTYTAPATPPPLAAAR